MPESETDYPTCPKCGEKVYEQRGQHINTRRVASAGSDKVHDRVRTRWKEFHCPECSADFAVSQGSLDSSTEPA